MPRSFDEDTSPWPYNAPLEYWFCSESCIDQHVDGLVAPHYALRATVDQFPALQNLLNTEVPADSRPSKISQWKDEIEHLKRWWAEDKAADRKNARADLKRRIDSEALYRHEKWFDKRGERYAKETQKLQEASERRTEKLVGEIRIRAAEQMAFDELTKPQPVPEHLRTFHTHILGPSGSGKTQLLQKIILDDLQKPNPPAYLIIDPKGSDLFEPLAHLNLHPDKILYVDPFDRPAINLFQPSGNIAEAISNFSYIFSTSRQGLTGPQETCFSFCIRMLFALPNPNLFTLLDLLDDDYKKRDPRFLAALPKLDDITRRFFDRDYYTVATAAREQIKNRVYAIARDEHLRAMFDAPERRLDISKAIRDRKIILVTTRMETLKENHQILGRFLISQFFDAVITRQDKHPAFLVVDEAQEFVDGQKIPHMLRLMRSYGAGAILAHHNMYNDVFDDSIRSAISTNTGIKYAADPRGQDINYMARDFNCEPDFLTGIKQTPTHVRFACTFSGLSHPFVTEVEKGHINRHPQLNEGVYRRLRELNRDALTRTKPETIPLEERAASTPIEPAPKLKWDL